jgi:uracil-DNA glycosylase
MPPSATLAHVPTILERLHQTYPNARYELNWDNPLQLLVATILAAQCTDERVNQTTPALFARYPDAKSYAEADPAELENLIRNTGFYRQKAKTIRAVCQELVARFGGEVPRTMKEMVTLPGVARKTANVVLNNAFGLPSGVIVDTHVARVSQRLGLSERPKPERIEQDLMRIIPKEEWIHFGPALVLLGRYTCTAHEPKCGQCILNDLCPKRGVTDGPLTLPSPPPGGEGKGEGGAGLPDGWRSLLADELTKDYFRRLQDFVAAERATHTVFPPENDVFNAFKLTPYERVKVLLLGQDPYHDDGQAHGLCFSVRPGVKPPPSLVNIFKELHNDLGCKIPNNGYLVPWAEQGVMLLNAVLTVRAHEPASHAERGWETFTDAVIAALNAREQPIVFVLWGGYAQKKSKLIDASRHRIVTAAHPSPLSAKKFLGSKPFSAINRALEELGQRPIDWQLPDITDGKIPESVPPLPPQAAEPIQEQGSAPSSPPVSVPAPPLAPTASPPAVILETVLNYAFSLRAQTLLPADWRTALADQFSQPYFRKLEKLIGDQRRTSTVCPSEMDVFNAFRLTPLEQVKVVLLGDAPPSDSDNVARKADGLAFSVRPGAKPTPAAVRIFEELQRDRGCWIPTTGDLAPWARQGVLLLNNSLTIRQGEGDADAASERKGWDTFTQAVLRVLSARSRHIVFVLWGEGGRKKERLIDPQRHTILTGPHPLERGFAGSRPFSAINNALELHGQSAIWWQLFAG